MPNPNFNPRTLSLVIAATLFAGCATQPPAPLADADAAAIASVFFAERARTGLARGYWRTERASWGANCVSGWDVGEMGQALVPALRRELSDGELRQAHDFLATPTGQRYAQRAMYRAPRAPATPEEAVDLRKFSETAAGRKLMDTGAALRMGEALSAAYADKLEACRQQHASFVASNSPSRMSPPAPVRKATDLSCTAPQPTYPREAIRGEQTGSVTVRFWLNPQGIVYMTLVVKSSNVPSLDAAAEKAIQSVQCQPFLANGHAITVTAEQSMRFDLR